MATRATTETLGTTGILDQSQAIRTYLRLGSSLGQVGNQETNHVRFEPLNAAHSAFVSALLDNNHIEQQIRPWALGRKNWLFAGSLRNGKRAAALMSLMQSAKLNGHDPYAYLKDVLTRLPTQRASEIQELASLATGLDTQDVMPGRLPRTSLTP